MIAGIDGTSVLATLRRYPDKVELLALTTMLAINSFSFSFSSSSGGAPGC